MNNLRFVNFGFIVFFLLYATSILLSPLFFLYGFDIPRELAFGTLDWLSGGVNSSNGRFFPLAAQQYNFIRLFTDNIFICYTYRTITFVLSVYFLYKTLNQIKAYPLINKLLITIVLCTPASINVWFSLTTAEGDVFFLLSWFLFIYLRVNTKPNMFDIITMLFIANIVLYYKEPLFILIGAFGFFQLFNKGVRLNNVFHILLILSASIFLLLYIIIIYTNFDSTEGVRYGVNDLSFAFQRVKTFLNFFVNEPFFVISSLVLIIIRITHIFFKKDDVFCTFDVFLLASFFFFIAYIVLNMYSVNYIFPAYAFFLPALVYFLFVKKYYLYKSIKGAIFLASFIFIFNALPLSLNQFTFQRYADKNYQNFISYLSKYIMKKKDTVLFFDGVSRDAQLIPFKQKHDRNIIVNVTNSLISKDTTNFDIRSGQPFANGKYFDMAYKDYPISIYNTKSTFSIQKGDLYIITPHSRNYITKKYLEDIEEEFDLLFKTTSVFAIPNFSLKNMIKTYLLHEDKMLLPTEEVMLDRNAKRLPEYYVYKKR